ncbi:MAG: hypothetical protein KKE17_11030, partial [Proteobacteria bacterium]|nr:hypothetical protein [Pseudomonadota bacterium]
RRAVCARSATTIQLTWVKQPESESRVRLDTLTLKQQVRNKHKKAGGCKTSGFFMHCIFDCY